MTTPKKTGTMERGHPKLIRNRQSSISSEVSPQAGQSQATIGPLTIVSENMTNEDVDRAIDDAEMANTDIHIKDINGKVFEINSK